MSSEIYTKLQGQQFTWTRVPISRIREIGILDALSPESRHDGEGNVYLAPSDIGIFVQALIAHHSTYRIDEKHFKEADPAQAIGVLLLPLASLQTKKSDPVIKTQISIILGNNVTSTQRSYLKSSLFSDDPALAQGNAALLARVQELYNVKADFIVAVVHDPSFTDDILDGLYEVTGSERCFIPEKHFETVMAQQKMAIKEMLDSNPTVAAIVHNAGFDETLFEQYQTHHETSQSGPQTASNLSLLSSSDEMRLLETYGQSIGEWLIFNLKSLVSNTKPDAQAFSLRFHDFTPESKKIYENHKNDGRVAYRMDETITHSSGKSFQIGISSDQPLKH